jgi:hypothetical protein
MKLGFNEAYYLSDNFVAKHPTDQKAPVACSCDNSLVLIQVRDTFQMRDEVQKILERTASPAI